jgi:hypothetical protein
VELDVRRGRDGAAVGVAQRLHEAAGLVDADRERPGPNSSHCRPIFSLPSSEFSSSLVVIGRVHS